MGLVGPDSVPLLTEVGEDRQTDGLLDACEHVDPPVGLDSPPHLLTLSNLLKKVLLSLGLALPLLQRLPQVAHVCLSAQLWDSSQEHEGEKSDEQL